MKWMNSNIRCTVTDGPFSAEICQGCMFNPKEENPYWAAGNWYHSACAGESAVCRGVQNYEANMVVGVQLRTSLRKNSSKGGECEAEEL